jgi:amiloride-sensitive sodium channel subunit alpha
MLLNKEKIIKIKQKTYSLLEVSTAHGLPNIVRAKNVIILIMWSIITSLSTCAGLYFVINDIINFLKYDTVTVLEAVNEQHSQFPTISICGYPPLNTSIDKLLLKVRFDRIDETNLSKIFEEFNDNIFGKCFRYNSGRNIYNETYDILNATNSGMPNNLKINFYLDIPDGYDFPELLIHIHNHSLPPYDMENGGYWLKSGSWNYYEIEREFYSFLDEPYNDCLKDVSSFAFNKTLINFISKRNRMYSQDYCYYLCSSLFALEESNCNCTSNLNNFDKDCLRSYTDVFESNKKKCVAGYLKEFREKYQHEKCSKYCPLECDSMNYLINNYFELFPDSGQISLKAKSDYDLYNFSTYEEVSKHFIDLSIYYKNLKYKFISQNPKTEMFNFISNIGGLMGVFLGVSFLSFIEIFEILYEIIIILFFN